MNVYRQFIYRVPKLSSALPLLESIDGALRTHGVKYGQLLFRFDDCPLAKTSTCDRVVKKFPALSSYLLTYTNNINNQIRSLTNFGPGCTHGHSTPPAKLDDLVMLKEIAAGIPRPYPFHEATFIFDDVQWWQDNSSIPRTLTEIPACLALCTHASMLFPAIIVQSRWWTSGRQYFHAAMVGYPPAETDADQLLPLPTSSQCVLKDIGSLKQEHWEAKFDKAELSAIQKALSRIPKLTAGCDDELNQAAENHFLEHSPPASLDIVLAHLDDGPGPLKATLVAAYKPLGYRYDSRKSGHGGYELVKKTARNNQLTVSFDVGPISRDACCHLMLEGLGWKTGKTIPITNHSGPFSNRVTDQETWAKFVANSAIAVSHYERTFVSPVELLFPPTPKWFRYGL